MRSDPKKRLPRLETLQVKKPAARVRQSWQTQMGIMDMWVVRSRRNAAKLKAMGK
jgi:hypothetical protein